jgi:uncharacterized membrane protein
MGDALDDLMSALDFWFRFFCHQIPERSPHFDGTVFPLCFRCAGLHLGLMASFIYLTLSGSWQRRLPDVKLVLALTAPMTPFIVDSWGNALNLWSTPGWGRSLTGLGFGMVLPLLLVPLLRRFNLADSSGINTTLPHLHSLVWPALIGAGLVFLLINPGLLVTFQLLAILAWTGLFIFLICLVWAASQNGWLPVSAVLSRTRRPATSVLKTPEEGR